MSHDASVEQQILATIDKWVEQELRPIAREFDQADEYPSDLVEQMKELGLFGATISEEYGGLGLSASTYARIVSRICEVWMAPSGIFNSHLIMASCVERAGTQAQKEHFLPKFATGELRGGIGLTEPDAGSDLQGIRLVAKKDGNDYALNGTKTWISNGGIADQYVLFARTGDAPGAKGLSAFVVEADTPGFSISERINVIAPHPLATITFDNCRIPTTAMLGNSGDGFKVAMATLDVFRTSVGGASLGFARRAMDEAIDRSKERQAFGKPISDFQLIQAKIADMAVKVDAMALLIYRSAWVKDVQDIRVTRESSMAKLYGTEAAQEVIDQAVQIFGGMGVVSGVPVERLYREIRALRIYEGTSEIQRLVIAGQALAASTS